MRNAPIIVAAALGLAACGGLNPPPDEHSPRWIGRTGDSLVEKFGKPDKVVHLPAPSLTYVYLYGAGNAPGFAICEHDYYIRGTTIIGYSEHGTQPGCNRAAGRTE